MRLLHQLLLTIGLLLLLATSEHRTEAHVSKFACFVDCASAFKFTNWPECVSACRHYEYYIKDPKQKSWKKPQTFVRPEYDRHGNQV